MRILIVKRDKLGDMLLTTPLIAHLHEAIAGAEICVYAADYCGWVVEEDPDVSRLWTYPRLRLASLLQPKRVADYVRASREIRRARFDVAIAAGGEHSPRAVKRALRADAARTLAYAPREHRYGPRLTDALEPPTGGHEVDRMLALAAPLRVAPPARPIAPRFRLPEKAAVFARAWLAQRKLAPGGFVVLGLGTRRALRQPSTAQILNWTRRWYQSRGLQTVFMWTPGKGSRLYPGDDAVAAPVLAANRPDIHPFRGPVLEALGLIWAAATSVFPDSGLMHFAAASPGGVVGLFAASPSWPQRWAPRGPRARWILAPRAVPELPDDELFAALEPLLAEEVH
jgi:ADP-heptose:LPS heptosyltransferase